MTERWQMDYCCFSGLLSKDQCARKSFGIWISRERVEKALQYAVRAHKCIRVLLVVEWGFLYEGNDLQEIYQKYVRWTCRVDLAKPRVNSATHQVDSVGARVTRLKIESTWLTEHQTRKIHLLGRVNLGVDSTNTTAYFKL